LSKIGSAVLNPEQKQDLHKKQDGRQNIIFPLCGGGMLGAEGGGTIKK